MGQRVTNFCDRPKCEKEYEHAHIKVMHFFNSRSHYSREYCSLACMLADAHGFRDVAERRSMRD